MKNMKKILALALALAGILLLMTGCSGPEKAAEPTAVPTEDPTKDIVSVSGGTCSIRVPIAEGDQGDWLAGETDQAGEFVVLESSGTEDGAFVAVFKAAADGNSRLHILHYANDVMDEEYVIELQVRGGTITKTGGAHNQK